MPEIFTGADISRFTSLGAESSDTEHVDAGKTRYRVASIEKLDEVDLLEKDFGRMK